MALKPFPRAVVRVEDGAFASCSSVRWREFTMARLQAVSIWLRGSRAPSRSGRPFHGDLESVQHGVSVARARIGDPDGFYREVAHDPLPIDRR